MSELLHDPFSLIILSILAVGAISALVYQVRVRTGGHETEATVTQIIEKEMPDTDTVTTRYYEIYVTYFKQDGTYVEATLSNPNYEFYVGQKIRIKYIDSHPEAPVYIGE